ncbi:MAG: hypothetical protein QJR12_10315 [Mycobacterium sp.]|uniref:hypothetical protein n=1 Tax=Mycobacterium sp. TaxID=1785 RepID=UPI002610FA52|nr:hypothetical protein [Mycobacterium sp.]MDI3314639.1 hypothetical protein [Mycobacterium sp.]
MPVAACATAFLLGACEKISAGTAVRAGGTSLPATTTTPTTQTAVPGVETTLPEHIPPNAFACFPQPSGIGTTTVATVSDPAAPRITVAVPDGWTSSPGDGDVALTLSGPDDMTGKVTIAATTLDPAAAFSDYAASLRGAHPHAQVDVAAAQFCGYSSQKLTGTFPGPSGDIAFADRITDIWTNTKTYLVTIHLEGPAGAPGFDAAKAALMQEFAIVIP